DIDIIGNQNLNIINDAEIPALIYATFKDLDIGDFTIKINNRKLLRGFFNNISVDDITKVLRVIDKLDKIGLDRVKKELVGLNLNGENIDEIIKFIDIKGNNNEIIDNLKKININNELFQEGLDELSNVIKYINLFGVP